MSEYNHKIGSIKSPEDLYSLENFEVSIDFSDNSKVQLEVIDKYTFSKEQAISCSIKGCRQPHQSGYLVITNNNTLTNIGNRCGERIFGMNFKQAKEIFKNKERVIKNKESLMAIRDNIKFYNDRVNSLIRLSSSLFKCKQAFKTLLPNIFQEVLLKAKTGDSSIYKNASLSERDIRFYGESKSKKINQVKIGDIFYCDFFLKDICELVRNNIKKPIDLLEEDFNRLNELRDKELSQLSKSVNEAIIALPIAEDMASKGAKFYNESNLKNLTLMRANDKSVADLIVKCRELLNN